MSRCLILAILAVLVFNGCGDKPASPPKSTSESSADKPSDSTAGNTGRASDNEKRDAAATAGAAASPANAGRAKPPAAPSAEQIAKWAIPDHEPLQLLACYDGFSDHAVQSLAVSPDGKQFVLGGAKLTIWTIPDSAPASDLLANYKDKDVERPIRSVAISPDGKWLAAGDQKGTLRIWNMSDQSEAVSTRAHDGRLTQLAFSPDSQTLATTSYSGEIRLWQVSDGKKTKSLKVSDREIARLAFLADQRLAVAGQEMGIWDIEHGTKELVLSTGSVIGPSLGLSADRQLLAFGDADAKVQLWGVEQPAVSAGSTLHGGARLIDFSPDGKWIATYGHESTIHIWDAAGRQLVQVIDADGGRTADLKWLPQSQLLVVASENGRVRLWGAPEAAKAAGLEPIARPALAAISAESRKPLTPAQLQQIIDVRSFPQLPASVPQWIHVGMASSKTLSSRKEAELFYRYYLGKAGWQETTSDDQAQQGMAFRKQGCVLNVSLMDSAAAGSGNKGELHVGLHLAGNYDVRWLPRISDIKSNSSWNAFSSVSYRTKAELTDLEVSMLKQFHDAGWTGYTRLAASGADQPDSRMFSMLQGGSVLTILIGRPAGEPGELAVQVSVGVSNKSLPIPPDSGWIEFDSSTDLQLVANTKMNLDETIRFFDTEMAAEGWLAREAGRHIEEGKGWLPYIRGQQDVLIRLVSLADGKTRVIVGDAESSSWQLQKPRPVSAATEAVGLEAADFPIPKGAKTVKFDVDEKQILFDLAGVTPPELAEQLVDRLKELDWHREKGGVTSDEYTLLTLKKEKAEIQIRARAGNDKVSSVLVGGDGLLWAKPLPTPPVRVPYDTWLRRNRFEANLDRLDQFSAEMHKIPVEP